MQTVTLSEGDKPYTVTACVVLCGKDIAVVIGGGLASKFNTNVAVTAGLHIDDADSDDIAKLQHNFQQILEAIEAWLQTIDI